MSIEAIQQALEALEMLAKWEHPASHITTKSGRIYPHHMAANAATTLRTAIAEAEKQEPFGYFQYAMRFDAWVQNRDSNKGVAFYTTPPAAKRQWVGLTDEEISDIAINNPPMVHEFARAIEAKLCEKNGGQV
jgi:hypothetical protein